MGPGWEQSIVDSFSDLLSDGEILHLKWRISFNFNILTFVPLESPSLSRTKIIRTNLMYHHSQMSSSKLWKFTHKMQPILMETLSLQFVYSSIFSNFPIGVWKKNWKCNPSLPNNPRILMSDTAWSTVSVCRTWDAKCVTWLIW